MTATTAVPLDDLAQRIAQQQSELEALRREYEARQTQLANLQHRKEELESLLGQVETQMRALAQGSLPKPAPSAAKQGASSPTLPQVLVEIVGSCRPANDRERNSDRSSSARFPTTSRDIPNLVCTRVKELVKKGSLCQANGQPGVVLGTSGNGQKTASPAAKRLAQVGGKNGAVAHKQAQRTKPAHRQGQPSLRAVLSNLLQKSKRPLTGSELAQQALATGYQTRSKNFVNVVWVVMGTMKNVEHLSGKGYRLKK